MARTAKKEFKFQIKPMIDIMGVEEVLDQVGDDRCIDRLVTDQKRKKKVLAKLLDNLSEAERAELKRNLE